MDSSLIQCPKCHASLLAGMFNQPELEPCPSCRAPLQTEVFPAYFRRLSPGKTGEEILIEGESGCFYHPKKKAVQPCEMCGRFLCSLCDCELNGQHLCPSCLEAGKTKGKIRNLDNQRILYDRIALAFAIYPVAVFCLYYFTFITAPVALYIAIRYWNAPRSIVQRTRIRHVCAILIALLQIGIWIFVLVFGISTRRRFHG